MTLTTRAEIAEGGIGLSVPEGRKTITKIDVGKRSNRVPRVKEKVERKKKRQLGMGVISFVTGV